MRAVKASARIALLCALFIAAAAAAVPQAYPAKPMRFIVAFPAGGTELTDAGDGLAVVRPTMRSEVSRAA